MTEKELHRLRRQDLLQLLLAQSKEVARQQKEITQLRSTVSQLREENASLQQQLSEKDSSIRTMLLQLQKMDASLGEIQSRLDRPLPVSAAFTGAVPAAADTSGSETPKAAEEDARTERLRYLRELLAKSEADAERLRKGQA